MGLLGFFKKGKKARLSARAELDLSPWIDNFYHREVTYIRENHTVRELVHFHTEEHSVWGYTTVDIPDSIQTVEELLKYLQKKNFHLK